MGKASYEKLKAHKRILKERVRQNSRALLEANKRLKKLEKTRNQYLFDIGHELKTPLAVVEMNLSALFSGQLDSHEKELSMRMLKHNIVRLKKKIEEIIQLSRMERGGQIQKNDIYLGRLVKTAFELHKDFAAVKGLAIKYTHNGHDPAIIGDDRLVTFAIDNLISNAVKFTDRGEVGIDLHLEGRHAVVSVSDTGKGIGKTQMKKLFKEFYKGDPGGPGTGVGLFISKKIAKAHGGDVVYEPNRPQGAIFKITFPIKKH
ncbi:HAMP domain-containing histidine kinase [Candidatus Parvarchaeota archaeon]|nr:HAMP domain-containing histidine kinase [Candidatus Parvarchaeota archaeon]